ncbi:DMT family transporter, partial [Enterococcus faecalis]|uniref:DMT family transporter n=1 Tax=Enterococcus faecalis TaxID=1351 RepID=UPI003CC5B738
VRSFKLLTTQTDIRSLLILILAFSCSFLFLYLGMRLLPMGVSYAVWTGIGTAVGAILGMLLGESKDLRRIFFFFLIIFS